MNRVGRGSGQDSQVGVAFKVGHQRRADGQVQQVQKNLVKLHRARETVFDVTPCLSSCRRQDLNLHCQ